MQDWRSYATSIGFVIACMKKNNFRGLPSGGSRMGSSGGQDILKLVTNGRKTI